jgi:hypothetical protein
VDLQLAWKNEALDLTPWLQRNIDALSAALGITIIPTQREVFVGDFRLDLLGEDEHGRVVIIENQLGPTDHSHLGQLLVYASGLEAAVVVWLTKTFRPEHRRALDWLNERTDDQVHFFGVELELVRIATSPLAPVFRVVAQPNDWQKEVKKQTGGAMSEVNQQRMDFYTAVMEMIAAKRPGFRPARSNPDWVGMASGPFGYYGLSFAQGNRLRVEIYLDLDDASKTKTLFDALAADKGAIELALGETYEWERLDNKKASRIAAYRPTPNFADPIDRAAACEWAASRLTRLMETLDQRLRRDATAIRRQQVSEPPETNQSSA